MWDVIVKADNSSVPDELFGFVYLVESKHWTTNIGITDRETELGYFITLNKSVIYAYTL